MLIANFHSKIYAMNQHTIYITINKKLITIENDSILLILI